MRPHEIISDYVKLVCQQIRWKKSHERISEEMFNHIIDGRDAYINQGLDEEEAVKKAITDSGDALVIGTQLDRIHRPKPQWGMFLWVAGFLLLGVLLSQIIFPGMGFPYSRLTTRLFWTAIGTVLMFAAYITDFSILGKYPWRIFIVAASLVMGAFFLIPAHVGRVNTFHLGSIQLRNITLIFPVILVPVIYTTRNKGYRGLVISSLAYAFLCLVAIAAPQSGITAFGHFTPVGMALLIFAVMRGWFGANKLRSLLLVAVSHLAVFILWLWVNIQSGGSLIFRRMGVILNPGTDPAGRGFFPVQVRRLLSSAALFGEGTPDHWYSRFWPMYDMQQTLYSDYLLATVIFRFGWLVFGLVMCILVFFIAQAISRCLKQKSSLGFFASIAIIMMFAMQVFTYVIFNLGFGIGFISLPLISPGNTATVINMGLIGFMLSVFRTGDAVVDKKLCS
ncbi:MAG: FtsW/RodA/SpoVE family cell cycle protein [Defluviitaleaceae bacterium]|nr:FtsW/RodA/SpoVE family cell cycle protein [Defluviitaleaceae bacterium]